jgi:hypothetical protein
VRFYGPQSAKTHLQSGRSWAVLCILPSEMSSSRATSLSQMRLFFLKRASVRHQLSKAVNVLGRTGRCLSSTCVLSLSKALHDIHIRFRDTAPDPYTSTNWRRFPLGDTFTRKRITPSNSKFDHFFGRPATFELFVLRCKASSLRPHGYVRKQKIYTCPRHCEICCRVTSFHVGHAIN